MFTIQYKQNIGRYIIILDGGLWSIHAYCSVWEAIACLRRTHPIAADALSEEFSYA